MKQSKRNRSKGRTLETYNNKLAKITSRYFYLFKQSQQTKEVYLAVPEQDRKIKNKVFFCDKYPDLQKFLEVNKLREVKK